jgi:poly(3-hydroxybutyrate) depolymerase
MNPSNHAKSHYDYFTDLIKGDDASTEAHRKFYDEYNAVLDMDADYYLETIRVVFQDFSLVNGTWEVKNPKGKIELVRPQDIKNTALMSVEGELDDISGSGQTNAVHDICTGVTGERSTHFEVQGAGHYGIFSGRRWREHVYPRVKAFILANNAEPVPPRAVSVTPVATAKQAAAKTPIAQAKVATTPAKRAKAAPKEVAAKRRASNR